MRPLFTALALPIAFACALGQGREKTFDTDSGTVVLHYFTDGKVSTKEWTDKDDRWGHSWAYDRAGRVIVDHGTRKVGGHASVWFTYYPSGAVSQAEFSDAPDGGIQWYRSTTTFNEQGERTGFTEQGHDNEGPLPRLGVTVRPVPPPKQETVKEQRLYHNGYFVVNAWRKPCRVSLRPKAPSPVAQPVDATLLKGDTLRGGDFTLGEVWGDPLQHVAVTAKPGKGRTRLAVMRVDIVQVDPEHRRYYLIIAKSR